MRLQPSEKQSGTFTVLGGREVFGELTVAGSQSKLYLRDKEYFQPKGTADGYISGILHDMTRVSLIDCVGSPAPRCVSVTANSEHYCEADVFPRFIVLGDRHLNPDEPSIVAAEFSLDDIGTLFSDFAAFGCIQDAGDLMGKIVSTQPKMLQAPAGGDATIIYFAGKREIFSSDTALGTISASHNPIPVVLPPKEAYFRNRITITARFSHGVRFLEAIMRAQKVIAYMGLLVGRPQNLRGLQLQTTGPANRPLDVIWNTFPARDDSNDFGEPSHVDVLIDAVQQPGPFSHVLKGWLGHDQERHDARTRFFSCFSQQRDYNIDRLTGAANMFDILPDSAIPPSAQLSNAIETARDQTRDLFKRLPMSRERDSILSALGRLGKSQLKQKVGHRAQIVLNAYIQRFPELQFVTDEAVNCRNFYVHGTSRQFDYNNNFATVEFFTDTLEFVFAASELVEAGWGMKAWIDQGTFGSHPFGRYWASYAYRLQMLKTLLSKVSNGAQ